MSFVINRFSDAPNQLSMNEISRYMGARMDAMGDDVESRVHELLPKYLKEISCRACWMEVPLKISGNRVDMEFLTVESRNLAVNLDCCEKAVIFAATIGNGADRLTRAASFHTPVNALIFDAMGSTAIEWFCDSLCCELSHFYKDYHLRPRFSLGYGDLSLSYQMDLINVLDARRIIGLTLSDSLMMIPQKSVTAIVGLRPNHNNKEVEL